MSEQIEDPNRMSKEVAQERLNKIMSDPNHAYLDVDGKASPRQHDLAVAFVNRLRAIIAGQTDTISGYVEDFEAEQKQQRIASFGFDPDNVDKSMSSGGWKPDIDQESVVDAAVVEKVSKTAFGDVKEKL